MKSETQSILVQSCLRILRPLLRIVLRNGMSYGAFNELIRQAYAETARDHFPPAGRKQSVSHIAATTGLPRKEIKRLLAQDAGNGSDPEYKYNRAVRVISAWLNQPAYQTDRGEPACLPLIGEQGSFQALVRDNSGDMTYRSMLDLLLSAGSVALNDAGEAVLIRHAYLPDTDAGEKLKILGADVSELIDTIRHNLSAESDARWFQRKVSVRSLPASEVETFQQLAAEKSQQLLEELDAWLVSRESLESEESLHTVAVGIYFHDRESNPEEEENE